MDSGIWQLQGEDERFVRWLFQYDGLLGFSKAYKEGDRIRIISGPLKDMEGKIRRVDKRGMSGQVILSFYGKDVPVWLDLNWSGRFSKTGGVGLKQHVKKPGTKLKAVCVLLIAVVSCWDYIAADDGWRHGETTRNPVEISGAKSE
jgi:hypothetical protein